MTSILTGADGVVESPIVGTTSAPEEWPHLHVAFYAAAATHSPPTQRPTAPPRAGDTWPKAARPRATAPWQSASVRQRIQPPDPRRTLEPARV